jgi:hypothetical protein
MSDAGKCHGRPKPYVLLRSYTISLAFKGRWTSRLSSFLTVAVLKQGDGKRIALQSHLYLLEGVVKCDVFERRAGGNRGLFCTQILSDNLAVDTRLASVCRQQGTVSTTRFRVAESGCGQVG